MRKEFLGPLPLALGALIIASALLFPARAPAPPCDCPVYSASEFEALDRAGYPGLSAGAFLIVDGRVAEISPSEFVSYPYRHVRLEGASIQFNVTGYNPNTGPVGEWVRLTATHGGGNETQGPAAGHRWAHAGKTAPPGGSIVSLAGLALGLAVAAWGGASWKEFGRTRARAATLRTRVDGARRARAGDPAARTAAALGGEIDAAASMLRRGQHDSASLTLDGVESQLVRAARLGDRLGALRKGVEREAAGGFNAAPLIALLAQAERLRGEGSVPEAERRVERAEASLANLPKVRELLETAEASIAANSAVGADDLEAADALEEARKRLAEGLPDEALKLAARAVDRAREVSPAAQAAAAEITQLKDFLRVRPEFDRAREVRDRVRDADELYRLGQFERACAEARVGLWLADPNALELTAFEAVVKREFAKRGFAVDPQGAEAPAIGFLAAKAGTATLVVTSPWREYPSERILFACKDFIGEGGAARAVVYSSAFANTSTDERIRVVEVTEVVDLLRAGALEQVVELRPAPVTGPTPMDK